MLIPYNTDAPIYHRPLATIGLIVLNVMVFVPTSQMWESPETPGEGENAELIEQLEDAGLPADFENSEAPQDL